MKILVYIKEVADVAVPLMCGNYSGELREDWAVPRMDPADASAIEAAVAIKQNPAETHITLIHLGRSSGLVRYGLALGCDDAFCVDEESHLMPGQKAAIFARAARILGFDLILTGAKSEDTGHGQVGVLLASELNLPYAGPVVSLETASSSLTLTRQLAEGYRERVEAALPMVVAMGAAETHRAPSFTELLDARDKKIEWVTLPDIGLPDSILRDSPLFYGPLRSPVAKLKYAPAPDSALPAHDRIRKLIEGTVATREGKVITDSPAEALFETLKDQGWLDHLKARE